MRTTNTHTGVVGTASPRVPDASLRLIAGRPTEPIAHARISLRAAHTVVVVGETGEVVWTIAALVREDAWLVACLALGDDVIVWSFHFGPIPTYVVALRRKGKKRQCSLMFWENKLRAAPTKYERSKRDNDGNTYLHTCPTFRSLSSFGRFDCSGFPSIPWPCKGTSQASVLVHR